MKSDNNSLENSPLMDDNAVTATGSENEQAGDKSKAAMKITSSKSSNKKGGKKKDPNKKENFFIRIPKKIGRAFVNMWKELKNVTWPTFGKALSSTGIVLVVVGLFFLVLLAIDSGLAAIFDLVIR